MRQQGLARILRGDDNERISTPRRATSAHQKLRVDGKIYGGSGGKEEENGGAGLKFAEETRGNEAQEGTISKMEDVIFGVLVYLTPPS